MFANSVYTPVTYLSCIREFARAPEIFKAYDVGHKFQHFNVPGHTVSHICQQQQ